MEKNHAMIGAQGSERRWFWVTLMLSCVTIVAVVFAAWELIENRFFRELDYVTLHFLYVTRGIASSLLLAVWAAWYVLRQRRKAEEELRRSRERYRGLLEASPGAVALYDSSFRVAEWNKSAEQLYGYGKAEIAGRSLPTVPPEKEAELRGLVEKVAAGKPVLNVETLRRDKQGTVFEVELSLLPFREPGGEEFFLEVTADIRERVRLHQRMLEIEKLSTMGRMAAGTAHHLNTPLASMLLRVQMMRQGSHQQPCGLNLERIEQGIRFCQHFVRRLLEFGRRGPVQKQPAELAPILETVVAFLGPSVSARRASICLDTSVLNGQKVLADQSKLEALFLILLTNALDAVGGDGRVEITCQSASPGRLAVAIRDNGCGISAAHQARIFEPFFTTKEPGKGTGLGLAIAKNIVLEHGGSIHLESTVGRGTAVFLEFPVCRAPAGKGDQL